MKIHSFKKENLYCIWNDCLLGKKVIVADSLSLLYEKLESDSFEQLKTTVTNFPDDPTFPFLDEKGTSWKFAYVLEPATNNTDHNAVKIAFLQGHTVVRRYKNCDWESMCSTSYFDLPGYEYMVAYNIPSRVTNKVLAMWLAQGNGLLLDVRLDYVNTMYTFPAVNIDCEVPEGYKVMPVGENKWLEPTTEVCVIKEA
jgi:hypothetical protein